jgi:hypothetical protein
VSFAAINAPKEYKEPAARLDDQLDPHLPLGELAHHAVLVTPPGHLTDIVTCAGRSPLAI